MRWSEQTRKLLGVGADEPIGFDAFQARVHPDDRARRAQAVADAWNSGVLRNEYRIVRPDGQVRWVSSRGRVVRTPDGRERMLGVIGDITEQKNAVEALKEADRRKDEFLATLATSCAIRSRRCAIRSRSCSAAAPTPICSSARAASWSASSATSCA
jgi:PAS domain S-box